MGMRGETKAFSPRLAESATKAELGLEEKLAVVVAKFAAAPLTTTLLQPEGRFGTLTESKFWAKGVAFTVRPSGIVKVSVPRFFEPS